MNFAELMDSWITEKIVRAQTDLVARVGKLELRVAELEERAATLNSVREIVNEVVVAALEEIPLPEPLTESRMKDIVDEKLLNTDWADLIGDEITDRIDIHLENNLFNEVKTVLDDVEFRVSVR